MRFITKRRGAVAALLAAGVLLFTTACSTGSLSGSGGSDPTGGGSGDGKITTGTVGVQGDIQDISAFCGDKDITVALADGFGGNSWRKITRAIFEAEAAKCPIIK
jgi:ribose transport system substrate-binding protein